jgi:hypothetical protein
MLAFHYSSFSTNLVYPGSGENGVATAQQSLQREDSRLGPLRPTPTETKWTYSPVPESILAVWDTTT